jgi:HJR/Mrr/RecB family endonuclease
LGYEVEQTGKSGDQGVDLIVRGKGRRIAVQAKGYVDSVGNAAVQQAFTGKTFYGCHACAVVTNSRFTASALEAAQATECALVHEENFEDFVFGRVPFG